jgi:hypothetical protein
MAYSVLYMFACMCLRVLYMLVCMFACMVYDGVYVCVFGIGLNSVSIESNCSRGIIVLANMLKCVFV